MMAVSDDMPAAYCKLGSMGRFCGRFNSTVMAVLDNMPAVHCKA